MRILLIGFCFFLIQCSASVEVTGRDENTIHAESDSVQQELFDPSVLPDNFKIEPPLLNPENRIKASELIDRSADTSADSIEVDIARSVPGYRIQVFSTSSYLRANEAYLNSMSSILQEPVYLSYDAPNYKIRVGNFLYREDAELFSDENLKRIFPDAWIVRTFVNPYQSEIYVSVRDSLLRADSINVLVDTTDFRK